jgi:hypothetical protein
MRNALLVSVVGAIVIAFGIYFAVFRDQPSGVTQACTTEAKICPDGSAVGRTGPNCTFAACSDTSSSTSTDVPATIPGPDSGTLKGRVTISPTCPTERTPPDPKCAPKPYKTVVTIRNPQGTVVAQQPTDEQGAFQLQLPSGTYSLIPKSGEPLPRCAAKDVIVKAHAEMTAALSCDSGIR